MVEKVKEKIFYFSNLRQFDQKDFGGIIVFFTAFYFAAASILLFWKNAVFSSWQLVVSAIVVLLALHKNRGFWRDWLPFLFLFLSYEFLRGLIPSVGAAVNIYPMVDFDRSLFGYLPTLELQKIFYSPEAFRWYDYASAALYSVHLLVPLLAGMFIYLKNKAVFRRYTFAVVIVSYASFMTYILYPAMPPWFASQQGYIAPLHKIISEMAAAFGQPSAMPAVYKYLGVNVNAAVPSLHATYPFLVLLFSAKYFPRFVLWSILYVFGIWFAVVYLGEHYFADIIVGTLYAIAGFVLSLYLFSNRHSQKTEFL